MATNVPTLVDINCTTGEIIERAYTTDEISARELMIAEAAAKKETDRAETERVAALKESAKAKLVAGEPLTEEEASVLVI